jgi:hypothetical protein
MGQEVWRCDTHGYVPAEILIFSCGVCGEVLSTEALSTEMEICKCGATALDEGVVRIELPKGNGALEG